MDKRDTPQSVLDDIEERGKIDKYEAGILRKPLLRAFDAAMKWIDDEDHYEYDDERHYEEGEALQ